MDKTEKLKYLKLARKEAGLTQEQVSSKVDIQRSNYASFELGIYIPTYWDELYKKASKVITKELLKLNKGREKEIARIKALIKKIS